MKHLRLDLQDFLVILDLNKDEVVIDCKETRQELDMCSNRTYDLKKTVTNVEVDTHPMHYISIHFEDDTFLQIKLESSSTIVLDMFTKEGELIDEFGAWDFWDA